MDAATIETIYGSLARAATIDDAKLCANRFTRLVGHEHFICDFFSRGDLALRPFSIHNYSPEWLERASRVPAELYERDPVLARLDASPPSAWRAWT